MTCHYFDELTDHTTGEHMPACPNEVRVAVEPSPAGQFAPALLCLQHVGEHISDNAWNLGNEWTIEPASEDPDATLCEECAHPRDNHAFFPDGEPAALCSAAYKPNDAALIDHTCDCDGFVLYPKA